MINQNNNKIILSSQSPRRQFLIKELGLDFEVILKNVEEIYDPEMNSFDVPEYLAGLKIAPFIKEQCKDVVITSDTVVILEDKILGKPKAKEDAISMLQSLSGKTHHVVSGVCILKDGVKSSFSTTTKVTFDSLIDTEIEGYVNTFKPFDKAGSYGIQEWIGYAKVSTITGCYYNVMGIPLRDLYKKLRELKIIS